MPTPVDPEIIKKELFTAVVGDVMDAMGLTNQFLPPQIKALDPSTILLGRAMTVLTADCVGMQIASEQRSDPFGKMFEALDNLQPGEIYLCSGASSTYALWGELMSTRARHLGAAGAVVNGYSRDSRSVLAMQFPLFSFGAYAQDQGVRGRVIDFRCPLRFQNGTVVNSGDLIFGDIDGVVVIPRDQEREILEAALDKVHTENKVRTAIQAGMSATEAFLKYGVM